MLEENISFLQSYFPEQSRNEISSVLKSCKNNIDDAISFLIDATNQSAFPPNYESNINELLSFFGCGSSHHHGRKDNDKDINKDKLNLLNILEIDENELLEKLQILFLILNNDTTNNSKLKFPYSFETLLDELLQMKDNDDENNLNPNSSLSLNQETSYDPNEYYIIQRTWASDPIYIKMETAQSSIGLVENLFSKIHLKSDDTPWKDTVDSFTHSSKKSESKDLMPYLLPLLMTAPSSPSHRELSNDTIRKENIPPVELLIEALQKENKSIKELRDEASKCNKSRLDLFIKANQQYHKGRHHGGRAVAGYYAEEGRKFTNRMIYYNQLAAQLVLLQNHPNGIEYTLDLHGLSVNEATRIFLRVIELWYERETGMKIAHSNQSSTSKHLPAAPEKRTMGSWLPLDSSPSTDTKISGSFPSSIDNSHISDDVMRQTEKRNQSRQGMERLRPFTIVTGVGFHTVAAKIRLRPQLISILKTVKIWKYVLKPGVIVITGYNG